jgi:hypothetical protein
LGFGNRIEDPNNQDTKGITLSHKESPTKSPGWGGTNGKDQSDNKRMATTSDGNPKGLTKI